MENKEINVENKQNQFYAPIKTDFINVDHIKRLSEYQPEDANKEETDVSEPLCKKSRKSKFTGRNKKRIIDPHQKISNKLCSKVIKEEKCDRSDCAYSHDVKLYMDNKPTHPLKHGALGRCAYHSLGKCSYGVTCLFSDDHVDPQTLNNLINNDLYISDRKTTRNSLDEISDIQRQLWKKKYDFTSANTVIKNLEFIIAKLRTLKKSILVETTKANDKLRESDKKDEDNKPQESDKKDEDDMNECDKAKEITNEHSKLLEEFQMKMSVQDNQIKERAHGNRKIEFKDKLYLAPLTTVGNLPFRRLCVELGADITCGEMALSVPILKAQPSEWVRLKRHQSEKIFGVQLCGSFMDTMTRCTQLIKEHVDCDFVDINCGCPIDAIYKKGEGAGLMSRQNRLENIVRGISRQLYSEDDCSVPELTVKLRTGVYEGKGNENAHIIIPALERLGVSMVTVHGRSREQRYTKQADWSYIDKCSKSADSMPVFGNGDILSYEDYIQHREHTGVSGCMIARGALIKPWIFTEIKENRTWDISSTERLDYLKKFTSYGLEHWGSDERGVATTRRFLLEYLSFLHRYIPVGLLEVLPQRINDKPPNYHGRNDLETLMASSNCSDWVKISEMLLGPVPDGFNFLPKHRANSYA